MDAERTEQELQRRQKMQALRAAGIEPFQSRFDRTHSSAEAIALFESTEKTAGAEARTEPVSLAGRLVASRVMGKATFAHIQDHAGRIQLHVKVDKLGEEPYRRFTDLDLGDIIGVRGSLFRTRRGEVTGEVDDFVLLAKALRPLPEKYHGLKDKEIRFRQRYLDLIANPEVMSAVSDAKPRRRGNARLSTQARLRRGGDPRAADDGRRRDGQAVYHAPQCPESRPLFANRARAVLEAV